MQFPLAVVAARADYTPVGAASATFNTLSMAVNEYYVFISNTNCWIKQGTAPTASAGAGSLLVPAGVPVVLDGRIGPTLAVVQDSGAGKASLVPVMV